MIDEPDGSPDEPMIRKRPGRPPGSAKAAPVPKRAYARQPTRQEQPRDVAREPARSAGVVQGRNGEVLSRKRKSIGDMYEIPREIIPKGWEYQWNTYTVVNEMATDSQLIMAENGWRPVMTSRHPGRFMPAGHDGAIIRGGLRLEERPTALSQEARAEELDKARGQMRDQTESLKLSKKLPQGFEANKRYRGTGGEVRMTIDRGLDIPTPNYQMADDTE
jgi:hypothetical protein